MILICIFSLAGCDNNTLSKEEEQSIVDKIYNMPSETSQKAQTEAYTKNNDEITTKEEKTPNEANNDFTEVKLIYVVDGDTIVVEFEGKNTYVRLIGIDAPESVNPDESKNTPEGLEASTYLKARLAGRDTVYLEFDAEQTDKYGRLLAYVYLDGVMINKDILDNGYAKPLKIEPNTKHADTLK